MIKNFDAVKKELAELSEVVNKFKSEAVQLRIVELVFAGQSVPDEEKLAEENGPRLKKRKSKQRNATTSLSSAKTESKKPRAAGKGPKGALKEFIADGFFNQKRTIGAVVEHCNTKAHNYKNNELSGPLARLVRQNKLSRSKKAESLFEYVKK